MAPASGKSGNDGDAETGVAGGLEPVQSPAIAAASVSARSGIRDGDAGAVEVKSGDDDAAPGHVTLGADVASASAGSSALAVREGGVVGVAPSGAFDAGDVDMVDAKQEELPVPAMPDWYCQVGNVMCMTRGGAQMRVQLNFPVRMEVQRGKRLALCRCCDRGWGVDSD